MSKRLNLVALAVLVATLLAAATNAVATPLLAVDFGLATSPVETSGTTFTGMSSVGPNAISGYQVTVSGGTFYDRTTNAIADNPPFTYAELYRDFYYSTGATITLKIQGVTPNTSYDFTFYAFDDRDDKANTTFTPAINTSAIGSPTSVTIIQTAQGTPANPIVPTSNSEYANTTPLRVSSTTNTLDFTITGTGFAQIFQVNGFEMNAIATPEPSSILMALIGFGAFWRIRRK